MVELDSWCHPIPELELDRELELELYRKLDSYSHKKLELEPELELDSYSRSLTTCRQYRLCRVRLCRAVEDTHPCQIR